MKTKDFFLLSPKTGGLFLNIYHGVYLSVYIFRNMLGVVAQFLMRLDLCISVVIHTYNGEGNGTSWRKWGFVHLYLLKLWNHKSWNFFPAMQKTAKKKTSLVHHFPLVDFHPTNPRQKSKRWANFWHLCWTFFFRLPRCQSYSPTRNLHQCLDGALPIQATRNRSEQGQHTFVCLFVLGRRRRRSMKGIVLAVVVAILL